MPLIAAGINRAATIAIALLATGAVSAQPDYNYLEAQYQSLQPDLAGTPDADGYALRLSAPLEPGTFVRGEYSRATPDSGPGKRSQLRGGLGFFAPWVPGADVYGLALYEELDTGSGDEKGFGGELGLRWQLRSGLELLGGGRYMDLDESASSQTWFGGFLLELTPGILLSAQYENAEGFDLLFAGLRFVTPQASR